MKADDTKRSVHPRGDDLQGHNLVSGKRAALFREGKR
jgi:hypothetical protein